MSRILLHGLRERYDLSGSSNYSMFMANIIISHPVVGPYFHIRVHTHPASDSTESQ